MSEVKVNKISPRSGTGVQLGDSGDTITIPAGATINNQGTATNFGATGSASWTTTVKTATFTATAGEGYFCNTTAGVFTVNLPAGTAGAVVAVKDYANTFQTNGLTISANGSDKIGGSTDDVKLSAEGIAITLVFIDSTKGWLVTDSGLQSEAPQWTGTAYYLVVGGGGGGGSTWTPNTTNGAGGGAGGYLTNFGGAAYTLGSGITYTITVGTGGAGSTLTGTTGTGGSNSSLTGSDITDVTATGGGGGGSSNGASGGSGGSGGGGTNGGSAGSGNSPSTTPAQGFNGGVGGGVPNYAGGGGGGASEVGGTAPSGSVAGSGGDGNSNSITGSAVIYAGGGGGGTYNGGTVGSGGTGGGGNAGSASSPGAVGGNGTDGLGGGGGGATYNGTHFVGGDGGNGVVIIRLLTTDFNLTTVTGTHTTAVDGTDTIITWTASPATLVT